MGERMVETHKTSWNGQQGWRAEIPGDPAACKGFWEFLEPWSLLIGVVTTPSVSSSAFLSSASTAPLRALKSRCLNSSIPFSALDSISTLFSALDPTSSPRGTYVKHFFRKGFLIGFLHCCVSQPPKPGMVAT